MITLKSILEKMQTVRKKGQETKNNTETNLKNKQIYVSSDIIKHIAQFLSVLDQKAYSQCSHFHRNVFFSQRKSWHKIEQLLNFVFNGISDEVNNFLQETDNKNLILKKSSYREGYQSKKSKKFICFRFWPSVSPLQAAALCGDTFLINELVSYIEQEEKLRLEAVKQLEDVLNGVVRVKDFKKQFILDNTQIKKISMEKKETTEKTSLESNFKYLSPIKELVEVYDIYVEKLCKNEKDNSELILLWETIGEYQKRLPRFVLQVYCDDTQTLYHTDYYARTSEYPPYAIYSHTPPPNRKLSFNLDEIGCNAKALNKTLGDEYMRGVTRIIKICNGGINAEWNAGIFNHEYLVRKAHLEYIIQQLKIPCVPVGSLVSNRSKRRGENNWCSRIFSYK